MTPTWPGAPAATQLKTAVPLVVPGIGGSFIHVAPELIECASTTCFPPAAFTSSDATQSWLSRLSAALGNAVGRARPVDRTSEIIEPVVVGWNTYIFNSGTSCGSVP